MEQEKPFHLYILECDNGSYYTGITTDLEARWRAHIQGKGAKYTRSFPPKRIAASWEISGGRPAAQSLEKQIKQLSKSEKLKLILNPSWLWDADLVH